MYLYNVQKLVSLLTEIIKAQVDAPVFDWLMQQPTFIDNVAKLNAAFAAMPRRTGKAIIHPTTEQELAVQTIRPHFNINGWSMDRLCRVWLLLNINSSDKNKHFHTIENLFLAAEMHEQVALYSALPVLAYPEQWRKRCAEGIRSNIGDVLLSIMCHNPYPSEQLDNSAWNQMVLKAFFTEKPVHQIIGLDERANKELSRILSDYAHERWAAHRIVNPLLWRCVGAFIDENLYPDMERVAASENSLDREAAVLVCRKSSYLPARELLNKSVFLQSIKDDTSVSWEGIAQRAAAAV
jgi:hypothetical protein